MGIPRILTDEQVVKGEIDKPFLSYSTFQAFLDCPAALYFSYFMKTEEKRNFALGFGSAWDEALNKYAIQKKEGRLHIDEVIHGFNESFRLELKDAEIKEKDLFTPVQRQKIIDKYGEIPQEEIFKREREYTEFWRKWAEERLEGYHEHIGKDIKPLHIQKRFYIDFGDDIPFGYKGTIDRIDEDGAIVDNKTSKSRWGDKDLLLDYQGVGYSLFYRILNPGKVEDRVQFDVMVKTKTQKFQQQFQQLTIGIEPYKYDILLSTLSAVYRELSEGRFHRRLNKFSGSCSWCSYKDDCLKPSDVWSRPPSKDEVEVFLKESPDNQSQLNGWIKNETMKSRLVDWHEIGKEFKSMVDENPTHLQFWY